MQQLNERKFLKVCAESALKKVVLLKPEDYIIEQLRCNRLFKIIKNENLFKIIKAIIK